MKAAHDAGFFARADCMDETSVQQFEESGWIGIRNFFDIESEILPIHRYVNHLIDLKLEQQGLARGEGAAGPMIRSQDYLRLCKKDRAIGGEIYRACRHLCPLHQLTLKPELLALAKRLMRTEFINFIPYTAMRIDTRGEEQYLFPWHQDYPYIQGSIDGIVVWIPLFDLKPGDGGVSLIPGSHKPGLQRVELVDPDNLRKNGAHTIRIENLQRFDAMATVLPRVGVGDAVIFHTLLVHRSVPMQLGEVRWTTQIRYANFSHPDAVRRGWPGGMIEGSRFDTSHPDYVVN